LYCLPVFDDFNALQAALPSQHRSKLQELDTFKHVLTHKDLHIHPVLVQLPQTVTLASGQWVKADAWPALGLPAPVRKLLASR
jgi:A/G-specific adenine glycosylase